MSTTVSAPAMAGVMVAAQDGVVFTASATAPAHAMGTARELDKMDKYYTHDERGIGSGSGFGFDAGFGLGFGNGFGHGDGCDGSGFGHGACEGDGREVGQDG